MLASTRSFTLADPTDAKTDTLKVTGTMNCYKDGASSASKGTCELEVTKLEPAQ